MDEVFCGSQAMTDSTNSDLSLQSVKAGREVVTIEPGELVQCGDKVFRIAHILDFESVIGVEVETGRSTPLRINDLSRVSKGADSLGPACDLAEIEDKDWKIASDRYAAIQPLLGNGSGGRAEIEARAKEVGKSPATLYRWLVRYKSTQTVAALIPRARGWRSGKARILKATEEVIQEVIRDFYLKPQRPPDQKAVEEVLRLCELRGITKPSPMTIILRLRTISEKDYLRGRGYREKAKNKFMPAPGRFPNADYPLAVIQIDHTPADIILVDDDYRKPIGRPWITLAIDVYSRMVVGYYLSFDPPSETSVAMCVAHAMLPKEEWLLLHKVEANWPVWGVPKTIHVDNGADFRSNNFRNSCLAYGINLEFRPVKQPRYGGHIERMLGTLLREIHDLPGTTFSSIKEREGYDSEKHAAMTKSEFEEWFVGLICRLYHQRLHSSIGMTPLRKWELGIFGSGAEAGVGLPLRPANRLTVLLDFLPAFQRTVQPFGVTIDGLTYYAEALRPWINAVEPATGEKRDLIFRRDPRDISTIWFFDPELKQYFQIPFADQALPAMSVWEYQLVKEKLRREGQASVNGHQLARAITDQREKVDQSVERTKKARKQAQRRKEHEKKISPATPLAPASEPVKELNPAFSNLIDGDIESFGDIA